MNLPKPYSERLLHDEPLARYTAARLGGMADWLYVAKESTDELVTVVTEAWKQDIPVRILGGGANVLISDKGVRGLVVINDVSTITFGDWHEERNLSVTSETGLTVLARKCQSHGLAGLEWAVSVPGTVGGAVVNNAGAHGGDIASNLCEAVVLDAVRGPQLMTGEDLHYGYRMSSLKGKPSPPTPLPQGEGRKPEWDHNDMPFDSPHHQLLSHPTGTLRRVGRGNIQSQEEKYLSSPPIPLPATQGRGERREDEHSPFAAQGGGETRQGQRFVVLLAQFALRQDDPQAILERMEHNIAHRKATQPPGASLGSIFKNPPGDYAGRLIEAAGLKGYTIGGAQVSPLHANFFINKNNATSSDYHALIRDVRDKVYNKSGVVLEMEVELVGEW